MATGILLNVANMAVDPLIEPDIIFIIFAMIRISSMWGEFLIFPQFQFNRDLNFKMYPYSSNG